MENGYIVLDDVHKSFGSKKVLNGISISVPKGQSLVVIGGSGTGKSVMIKTILGILRADSGSAVREVAAFQSERLDGRLRKPAPRFDLLIRSHHCTDNSFGRLRILFGHEVDRADGRTAP